MTEPEKILPFALLERYWSVRPRLTAALEALHHHPDPAGLATPVEHALAAELIGHARRTTSREAFGRALRLLQSDEAPTRPELLARLREADLALKAFLALYHGGEEMEDTDEPYWRVDA